MTLLLQYKMDMQCVVLIINQESYTVKNASAGCQLLSNSNDFDDFMKCVYKQREIYPPNIGKPKNKKNYKTDKEYEQVIKNEEKFSYTLLLESDIEK